MADRPARGGGVRAHVGAARRAGELHAAIAVRYAGGAIGTISGTSAHSDIGIAENELEIDVVGSEGQFFLDIERGTARLARRGVVEEVDLGHAGGLYDCEGPPLALVDLALGRDVGNASPGELGARTVEILSAAYESARTGRPARVAERPHSHGAGATGSSHDAIGA